jgi:hypothetical protein
MTREPALAGLLVRETLAAIDPNQAVSQGRPLDDVIADARSPSRFRALVISLFALLAFVVAVVGVVWRHVIGHDAGNDGMGHPPRTRR